VPDREQDDRSLERKLPGSKVLSAEPITRGRPVDARDHAWRGPDARARLGRLILLGVSAGGVLACLALWVAGHGHLGLRVLAGDVVLAGLLLLVL